MATGGKHSAALRSRVAKNVTSRVGVAGAAWPQGMTKAVQSAGQGCKVQVGCPGWEGLRRFLVRTSGAKGQSRVANTVRVPGAVRQTVYGITVTRGQHCEECGSVGECSLTTNGDKCGAELRLSVDVAVYHQPV